MYVCMYVCVYACTYMYHVGLHATNVQETCTNMFSESCVSIPYSFLVDFQQQQKTPCSSTFSVGSKKIFYQIDDHVVILNKPNKTFPRACLHIISCVIVFSLFRWLRQSFWIQSRFWWGNIVHSPTFWVCQIWLT